MATAEQSEHLKSGLEQLSGIREVARIGQRQVEPREQIDLAQTKLREAMAILGDLSTGMEDGVTNLTFAQNEYLGAAEHVRMAIDDDAERTAVDEGLEYHAGVALRQTTQLAANAGRSAQAAGRVVSEVGSVGEYLAEAERRLAVVGLKVWGLCTDNRRESHYHDAAVDATKEYGKQLGLFQID
jgi:hypothetical protein